MKLSVSNISLPPLKHKAYLGEIRDLGVESIEIAPSRRWKNTWHGLKAKDVQNYRQEIEGAGLTVCGLHSLFFDQPDLSIFGNQKTRERTRGPTPARPSSPPCPCTPSVCFLCVHSLTNMRTL